MSLIGFILAAFFVCMKCALQTSNIFLENYTFLVELTDSKSSRKIQFNAKHQACTINIVIITNIWLNFRNWQPNSKKSKRTYHANEVHSIWSCSHASIQLLNAKDKASKQIASKLCSVSITFAVFAKYMCIWMNTLALLGVQQKKIKGGKNLAKI